MKYTVKTDGKNSFTFEKGEFIVVGGVSGCGKSLFLHRIAKSLINKQNKQNEQNNQKKQKISAGFVMQHVDSQLVTDKVWHEISFPLENLGTEKKSMRIKVAETANYFGLQEIFDRDIASLSGGQKQLVALASVMAESPEILILDEPFSQLDPIASANFLNTVKKLHAETGITVIMGLQNFEETFEICTRCVFLENGNIVMDESPAEIQKKIFTEHRKFEKFLPAAVRLYREFGELNENEPVVSISDVRQKLESFSSFESRLYSPIVKNSSYGTAPSLDSVENDVSLRDVWFAYGKNEKSVLRGIDVSFPKSKITALVGGNGSGKSTLLKIICGLLKADSGKIKFRNAKKTKVLMLSQNARCIFSKKSVAEELNEMIPHGESDLFDSNKKIEEIVSLCRLSKILSKNPADLSCGEAQRLAFAKMLVSNPQILLLDEPTQGMDAVYKEEFSEILKKLSQNGKTVILVSHDLEFCSYTADFTGMIFNGTLSVMAETKKFFTDNNFYTTVTNKICRTVFPDVVTLEDGILAVRNFIEARKNRNSP